MTLPPVQIKANAEVLKSLASQKDIVELLHIYAEYFTSDDDDNGDSPPLASETNISFGLGEAGDGRDLGMELEHQLGPDMLANRLGFLKHQLPHQFNQYRHHSSTAWDNPNLFNTKPVPNSLVHLKLHWHQLAGVHSVICNIFTVTVSSDHCIGMLICDEVRLGKTALAISTIAFLSQCILLQAEDVQLPPIIGMQLFDSTKAPPCTHSLVLEEHLYLCGSDRIKGLPHLIIVPGTLRSQWIHELKTSFLPKSIYIIPYDCPKTGNSQFWSPTGPFHSSKQQPQNQIIIMSQSVC